MADSNLHNYTVQEALNIQVAGGGMDYVSAGTVNAHTYVAITALDACTVSATSVDTDIWDSLTDIEVPAGTTIYGKFSAVTIGTGDSAIVYREHSTD